MLSISNSHSVGSDDIRSDMIKTNIFSLAPPLTYIFNLSFLTGIFPALLKSAIVTPIYKGEDNLVPSNYKPISIITVFSKSLKKLYYNILLKFVKKYSALHDYRYGFRTANSTSTAIKHVVTSLYLKLINPASAADPDSQFWHTLHASLAYSLAIIFSKSFNFGKILAN